MEKRALNLEEYAAQHPAPAPPAGAAARSLHEWQEEQQRAADLKQSILRQIREGNAPELILYTALSYIGMTDPEWESECKAILDGVYADLAQQSLLTDNAAEAAHRLDKMKRTYTEKTRAQILRNLTGCKRLSDALKEALQAIDGMADE